MLGHFRVEEQIGRGGMGAVFRAVDTRLDREVALKVLAGTQSTDRSAVDRFLNEARAAARLDHDNVARVYFVGEEHGLHFIAFEFIHGANVRQVIEARGRLSPAESVNYALQIAHALRHVANAGVVHRDVKPSNIIITPTGRAKLVDLGLARKVDPEASRDLTVDGTTLGTFDYISPEQAKDPRSVDIRSDIYSLGCTLYHMLTGEPPYPRGTMLQKLLDHQHKDVPDASARNSSVPPELSAVVKKMMASDPKDRYQSADELIGDLTILAHAYGLRPVASEAHVWAVPGRTSGWRLLHRYRAWIATAAMLVAGVVAIDLVQSLSTRPVESTGGSVTANETTPPDNHDVVSGPQLPEETDPQPGYSGQPGQWPMENGSGLEVTTVEVGDGMAGNDMPAAEGPAVDTPPESPLIDVPGILSGVGGGSIPLDVPLLSRDPRLLGMGASSPTETTPDEKGPVSASEASDAAAGPTTPKIGSATPSRSAAAFVVRADGEAEQEFATLEAACSAAPDGSVIELNFDGPSLERQRPIKVEGKRLRLKRGQGRTPIVRFAVPQEWTSAEIVRMVTVTRGSLDVYDVGFEVVVDSDFNTGSWVLLSLNQAEEVILRGVSVTIRNPKQQPAAIVEMAEPASRFDDRMPDSIDRLPIRFDAEDSLFRGQADLFLCENVDPARVRLSNVAAALSGSIIHIKGMDAIDILADMNNEHRIELDLRHVTALLAHEVVRFDVAPGYGVPRVAVSADNSVLVNSGHPLVGMAGEVDTFASRQLLEWSGGHSYVDSQDPVWRIVGPIDETDYDLAEWNDLWRHGHLERPVGTNLLPRDRSIPFHEMSATDLTLVEGEDVPNPARAGASDGTDAGVQWGSPRLPRIATSMAN